MSDDVRVMRDLHGRCVGVAIDRDDFAAKALQFDNDLLPNRLSRAA